jgi:antitoxin VapB
MKIGFADEILAKRDKLKKIMEIKELNGIILSAVPNQTWFIPTIEPYTPLTSDSSKVLLYVPRSGKIFVAGPENEMQQILERDFAGIDVEHYTYPWYGDERKEIVSKWAENGSIGSDVLMPNTISVAENLEMLRAVLTDAEQIRYRQLGSSCARILTEVLRDAAPGMTEAYIAGMVAAKLLPEGIVPEVLLVGSDERLEKFRHPHTTLKKVQRYVMINLTARRWGLYLSLTRALYFGKLPEELARKQQAAAQVDSIMLSLSKPGVPLAELYAVAEDAYARAGYPGEEKRHHQGGTTGYRGRERRAKQGETWKLMANQAIAFNPTVRGTKSEDTALVRQDKPEILSRDSSWPFLLIDTNGCVFSRPAIMAD